MTVTLQTLLELLGSLALMFVAGWYAGREHERNLAEQPPRRRWSKTRRRDIGRTPW